MIHRDLNPQYDRYPRETHKETEQLKMNTSTGPSRRSAVKTIHSRSVKTFGDAAEELTKNYKPQCAPKEKPCFSQTADKFRARF